jgi:hypothetical protein
MALSRGDQEADVKAKRSRIASINLENQSRLNRLRKKPGPGKERRTSGAKPRMAASWAVIWDSVCDFLHGKSQALSEGSAVKPAIRGSPTYSQSFTTRLKSCPVTKQSFSAACSARGNSPRPLPPPFPLSSRAQPRDLQFSPPAAASHRSAALPFVIPTVAGICSSADLYWKCFSTERTRISYCAAPSVTACAAFHRESRMKFPTPPRSTGNPGSVVGRPAAHLKR